MISLNTITIIDHIWSIYFHVSFRLFHCRLFIVYPKAIVRIAIVILNNLYCIPTYTIWMVLLMPLKWFNQKLYYKIEGKFFHWLLSIVTMWSWSAGYDIVESGDDIAPCQEDGTRTLLLANHQSTADVPLFMACFNAKPDVLPNIMWIMDRVFKFTNFGIVSVLHKDFFVQAVSPFCLQNITLFPQQILTPHFLLLKRTGP